MRAAVVGAGAVGLGVGSCLAAAGADVVFVCRPGAGDALARDGIERTGVFGRARVGPERIGVVESVAAAARALPRPDWLLVCTKSVDGEAVARAVAAAWSDPPPTVLFQNGWGNAERFAQHLPAARVFCARVITGFARRRPNAVEVTVHADAIRVGSLFGAPTETVAPLCRAIAAGGIPCEPSDAIERDLWAKMLYNCALNPLAALLGVPYGALGRSAATWAVVEAVVREVFEVMAKAGFATQWSDAEEYLPELHDRLLPATAGHEPSMLQDLRAGGRTEIDALSGAVAALGARHGVATPVNAALRDLVRAAETKARG